MRKQILSKELGSVREQTRKRLTVKSKAMWCSDLARTRIARGKTEMIYPIILIVTLMQFSDMRVFPARYATAFRISGDVFNNISGDALIDKISELFLLQTEASKKSLDFQVAGSRTGSIGVVKSATTGASGNIIMASESVDGDTFGSFKVKDGARLNVINGTTNAVRGSVLVVNDPGGNNRATNTVSFDQVPAGTVAGDYITYENSALKAPHGIKDLVNNDTGINLPLLSAKIIDLRVNSVKPKSVQSDTAIPSQALRMAA